MKNQTEFFRKTLNEFRAADELLSKQLKLAEDTESAEQIETTKKAEAAERAATGYLHAIEGNDSAAADFPVARISPQIDADIATLNNLSISTNSHKDELDRINQQIEASKKELREALLKEQSDRKKRIIRRAVIATLAVCTLISWHFWLLNGTTLAFTLSLDGKDLPPGISPNVTVDGKPFAAGDKINLGHHQIAISFTGGEPFAKKVWTFYGKNDLGTLPLESSKGSLSVTVNPSPASVILQREGDFIRQDDAPLNIDKLRVGDYKLIIHRGEYEETHTVKIQREQQTKEQVDLNLGGADLSSDPPDAEFLLMGDARHWQGKLPIKIDDIPGGSYSLAVSRKGWKLDKDISIRRAGITTNKAEFQYGSIEVTSDPTGMAVSTNGVEIGKAPVILQEVKPGQYTFTASDGENDLTAVVSVGPKEAAEHTFVFHYGVVKLLSAPSGATVIRKGKEIGKTPLTLNHIPAGETSVELQLQDYVTTNLPIQSVEGVTTNLSVKLISEHYLQAMKQAREAFDSGHFAESQKFITVALELEPNDPAAMELQGKVSQAVAKAEEASRAEQADAKARTLASLTWLDFQKVFTDCTDTKQVQNPVQVNDGYYDKSGKFHVTGQHTEMQTQTVHTYNPMKFSNKYQGRTFSFSCPDKWSVSKVGNDGAIMLKQTRGLFGSDNISVTAPASNPGALRSLQKGQKVTIKGVLTKCEPGSFVQTLYLENAEILDK